MSWYVHVISRRILDRTRSRTQKKNRHDSIPSQHKRQYRNVTVYYRPRELNAIVRCNNTWGKEVGVVRLPAGIRRRRRIVFLLRTVSYDAPASRQYTATRCRRCAVWSDHDLRRPHDNLFVLGRYRNTIAWNTSLYRSHCNRFSTTTCSNLTLSRSRIDFQT